MLGATCKQTLQVGDYMNDWPNYLTESELIWLAELEDRIAMDIKERRRLITRAKQCEKLAGL